jgi:pyruvate,orthophosphate dikinase
VQRFKSLIRARIGRDFPTDPWEQLWGAVLAVFESWNNERAKVYRELNDIPESWGTAVNVQAMVFGNLGDSSATGVAFTRDAGTGEDLFNGEFLVNAQGEDVVAGIRTPQQVTLVGSRRWAELAQVSEDERARTYPSLEELMPAHLPAAAARRDHAGEPLQRHAGPGVHHPGRQALDAADPQRQAHRRGHGAHRDGDAAARA